MDATRDDHTKGSKSERERQVPYDITYLWNLKQDTNEPTYKPETDSQTQRADLWLPWWGRGEGWTGSLGLDWEMQTITFRMDRQQGPTVQHREVYPVSWDKP